jgi:ABC-2 type transport system permease protein
MMITLMVTALSVAREKELGTFDQLLVSPLMPHEIVLGKTVPAILIGVGEGLLIWFFGVIAFGIPFRGSFVLLVLTLLIFVTSVVGIGLFISSLSKTQQQAILGTFIFMVPAITLSGFAAPIHNMPPWLQTATLINPLRHCMVTVRGLFLKDLPLSEVWGNTWPLLIIGAVGLLLSNWFFSKRLE